MKALAPNTVVTGILDASACTLADGTWYADYLVDFSNRGTWTASVTPAGGMTPFTVILRDQNGDPIASGATINRTIERGTYHILINAPAPNQGGGYTFTSSFTSAPNVLCRQFPMMGTIRSLSGSLGPGSCALLDGSVFDGYQLTLYGTGTVDIAVSPTGFTPLLILRNSDGYAIPGTNTIDANGALHLNIPEIGSDTFTLVVAVSSPDQVGGTYSVTASFTPDADETCVAQGALGAAQTSYKGTISTGSCNFNLPGLDASALFNYFTLHLTAQGVIQASIGTADFSPLLVLLDADGNIIDQDIESGGSGKPLIGKQLAAGDYILILFNEDYFGGSYTLNYQFTPGFPAPCAVNSMASGSQMTGSLSGAASCRDGELMSDIYQIVLPSDGTVNLSLASPDFSVFLDLHDAKDNVLTWGTPSSDETSSSLTSDLPAGTYYVYPASTDLPGGYTLSYNFTPKTLLPCQAPIQMLANEFIQNVQFGPTSCEGADGRVADFYQFTLPAASTEGIVMLSAAFPTDITLYQPDGTPVRNDRNSYAMDNAIIVQYLPAGNYLVKAQSADPALSGLYSLYFLLAQGPSPQLCAPLSLPAASSPASTQTSVSAQTSFTSCAWYDKTFADVYQLNIFNSTQILTITEQSNDFDAFLILMDAKGSVLATDDNSGGGTNALIVQSLDPGSYYIAVKPANDPSSAGNYVLTTAAMSPQTPDRSSK